MSTQVLEPMSGDTALSTLPDDPVGVSRERVDSYTLKVIDQLFPAPTSGVNFLALLLRLAHVKQLALEMEQDLPLASVAVIRVQSIKQLSQAIGWSYESTHKYVVLFCALGLLVKRRSEGMVELHFPLCRYQPPRVDSLDMLIEKYRHPKRNGKTDKRLKHAERVKRRFLCLYGAPSAPARQSNATTLVESDLSEAIGDVADLLGQAPENLPYAPQLASILEKLKRVQKNLTKIQHKAFSGVEPDRLSVAEVDSSLVVATRNGRFVATAVDSSPTHPAPSDRLSADKVDSSATKQGDQEESTPVKGDIPAQKVDSMSSDLGANVNVITIIDSITLNVDMVALFCCRALGEGPGRRGIYSKWFREVDHDAHAVVAALIFTLAHRHDGTIRKPPAVFIQRCRDYHQNGVPEEVAALVERYGKLTYPQLLDAVRQPAAPPVPSSSPVQREAPAHRTPSTLAPLRPNLLTAVSPRIPLKASGMTCEAAQRLHSQIADDRRVRSFRTGLVSLPDGTYAVIVDNTVTQKVNQVAFYSAHEWQERSVRLQCGGELFAPEGQAKPHPLQAFLQKRGQQ